MVEIKLTEEPSPKNESYASEVFQESSVGIVSTLAQTDSLRRKAFKILAFLLCLIGFLYQSGQFLAAVFQYPTTVDLDIVRPNILQVPGYTFCDNSGINRRIFCEKFPERCEDPSEKLCKKFEYYCGQNKSLVPKKEYYKLNTMMTLEEMVELNVKLDEFVHVTEYEIPQIENITGPYMRQRDIGEPSYICYSLYERVNSTLNLITTPKAPFWKEPVNIFTFRIRDDEVFLPGNRAGVIISLHSPYEAVNPFETGIFLKPGRTYMIFVAMEEEQLLQKPYKTDCVNYTEMWEKRSYTGPRTQLMCHHECFIDISMKCFNCVVPWILYPSNERLCQRDEIDLNCPVDHDAFDNCEKKCKDDCRRTKYTYTVQERFSANLAEKIENGDDVFTRTGVEIFLEGDEIFVLKHSPKYMIVEVFSNIGGFIGCWLGISLLSITDIFEGFFRIVYHSFKKKMPPEENPAKNSL